MRKTSWSSARRLWLFQWLLIGVLASQPNSAVENSTVWVSPSGRDDGPGTAEHPLATLTAALARAPAGHIILAPGSYQLSSPLALNQHNSGLVLEGSDKGQTILSGGTPIGAFERVTPNLWRARTSVQASRVWLGEKSLPSAKIPTDYWHYITEETANEHDAASRAPADLSHRAFHPDPADMAILSKLSQEDLAGVVVTLWHSWEITKHRISRIDSKGNMVYLSDDSPWAILEFGDVQRYQLDNVPGLADPAGTWYRGHGWIYYQPAAGQDMNRVTLTASGPAQVATIQGAQNITLRNIQFSFSGVSLDPGSFKSNQAASPVDAAIIIDDAKDVHLQHVTISHTSGYAIWFRRNCQNSSIEANLMEDLGAGGVRIGETAAGPVPGHETTNILVDNNIIRHGGRLYPSAVGVLIGNSGGNRVTHNEIHDLYYSGISVGWKWDYSASPAVNNIIESNHVHLIGQQQLADMAGIYTLGESAGTVVRGNIIHDVTGYPGGAGAWGIYADQGSSGIVFENNLVFRTTSGGFHENFGKDNVVRGNVLAFGQDGQVELTKSEAHRSLTFSGNVVISDGAPFFRGDWQKAIADIDGNTYFDISGKTPTWVGQNFAGWKQLGFDRNSTLADPGILDASAGDFRLKSGSRWSWNGASPIGVAGVYGDKQWVALSHDGDNARVASVPNPPPPASKSVAEDFESTQIGSRPANVTASVEGDGDGIAVSDEQAASGKHSLKLQDVQGEKFAYDPHFFYKLNHRAGTTHLEFRFYAEPGYCFTNEWRDGDSPYHVGPSLTVAAGQLRVGGNTVASVPERQWVTVKVDAQEGPMARREWHLAVSAPNGLSGNWTFPNASDQWHRLDWLGFTAACRSNARLFIDDIRIENHQ
jgi:Right handed beta helix region